MIGLLTGQPGNGKTSHLINIIRKYLDEGRTVYTVGIPKLKLPVIQISRAQLLKWHEREEIPNDNPDLTEGDEPIYKLKNIVEGSVIIVDEAQKGFEPSGTKVPEHISYLSEHRHHGLDFIFATQYPFLVHQTVRALITVHWHIRSTWKGRKIHEWPDWQERPQSATSLENATSKKYVIDKTTFDLYESASVHTKLEHARPLYAYFILGTFILAPVLGYFAVSRVYAKTQPDKVEKPASSDIKPLFTSLDEPKPQPEQITPEIVQNVQPAFENIEVVSNQYDWSQIGACMAFSDKCTCYGHSAQRLVVPDSVCRSAVSAGWIGRTNQPARQAEGRRQEDAGDAQLVLGVSGDTPDVDQQPMTFDNAPLRASPSNS